MHPALRIAQLLRVLRRVSGRKKFQKLVHTMQELGYPFPEQFEYSYYGMYSRQLRGELDSLLGDKLLTEDEVQNQYGKPSFTFEVLPQLDSFLDELGVEKEPTWVPAAKKLNNYNALALEGISTILYLKRCGYQGEQLKQRLLSLKPHLADTYAYCERETSSLQQAFAVPTTPTATALPA
jgi:uncharacterized protein YwgA